MSPILTKSIYFVAKLRFLLFFVNLLNKLYKNQFSFNMYIYLKTLKMKKILLPIFIVLGLLASCDAIDELTKFDLDYQSNFSIPPTTLVNIPIALDTPDITTGSESSFESNNTHKDLIESIKLKTMTITIETPEDGDFNFLKEIYIYINAEGLEEIEIANGIDLQNINSNVLELNILDQELREYIKEDSFNLKVRTTTDETINETHNIVIDTKFRVDAEILGV